MLRRSVLLPFLLLVILALLVPATASAGKAKKKSKPLELQGLADELAAAGEVTDDMAKVLRFADRCFKGDKRWERSMEDEVPINQLYEQLAGSVTCWQTAEKKATKLGDVFALPTKWVSARTRYIEAFRGYVWAIDAKLDGESAQVCRRLTEAIRQAGSANVASDGLVDTFSGEAAKALAAQVDAQADEVGQVIAREFETQKCK